MLKSVAKKWRIVSIIVALIISILFIYPLFWVLISSLKNNSELYSNPWALPKNVIFSNYYKAWTVANLGRAFLNSIFTTGSSVLLSVAIGGLASYSFIRMSFKGKFLYNIILISLALPITSIFVPLFILTNHLNLIDTPWGLILPYTALNAPLAMFILGEFFRTFPKEIEEAALVEGASRVQLLSKIIFPISKPAIIASGVLVFVFLWTEYTLALVIITNKNFFTVPLAFKAFTHAYMLEYPPLFASLFLTTIPVLVAFAYIQGSLIRGISTGSFK